MGRIYEFSEIENCQMPNFIKAKPFVLDAIQELVKTGNVVGARIYGSVAMGTANQRSDLDLLVIIKDISAWESLREIYDDVFRKFYVNIEPRNIIPEVFAEKGRHTVNKIFAYNIGLTPEEGNVAGKNPLDILSPATLTPFDNHELYLIKKRGVFTEGFFSRNLKDRNLAIQKALEAPVNMGREVLQMLPYFGYLTELKNIDRTSVVNKFNEVFKGSFLTNEFNYLYERDQKYTLFLENALLGRVSRLEYDNYIESLFRECVPLACSWTNKMDLIEERLIEGSYRGQEGNGLLSKGKESFM